MDTHIEPHTIQMRAFRVKGHDITSVMSEQKQDVTIDDLLKVLGRAKKLAAALDIDAPTKHTVHSGILLCINHLKKQRAALLPRRV